MRLAMSKVLERRFDGIIGAAGCSYTYQNLLFFKEDFWPVCIPQRDGALWWDPSLLGH